MVPGVVFRWVFILLTRRILHGIATQPHANIVIRRVAQILVVVVAVMSGNSFKHRIEVLAVEVALYKGELRMPRKEDRKLQYSKAIRATSIEKNSIEGTLTKKGLQMLRDACTASEEGGPEAIFKVVACQFCCEDFSPNLGTL